VTGAIVTSKSIRCRSASRAAAATLGLVFASLAACDYFERGLRPGSYRAALDTPVGELPFGLDVAKEGPRFVLYLINGEERVRVEDVVVEGATLRATLPQSTAALKLRVRRKVLEGELAMPQDRGAPVTLPLRAEFGKTYRFFEEPLTDNADVQGRWSVLVSRDGVDGTPAVAEFQQRFERVSGRVRTREAEGPLLVGEIHDEDLFLSRFDGSTAVLLRATVDARGALDGEIWSSTSGAARLQAVRNPDAVL
jgi:hypothetical protein